MKDPRMIFGFALLAAIFTLAIVIAIGHVSKETSYGLEQVLSCLATVAGGWGGWAFSRDGAPKA